MINADCTCRKIILLYISKLCNWKLPFFNFKNIVNFNSLLYLFHFINNLKKMVTCKDVLHTVFSYTTPKIVNIHSLTVGIISRVVQLLILSYIIGYVIVYKKGYQDVSPVQSSVVTKVKGIAYTNFSDDEFNSCVKKEDRKLYNRIWDVADYVIPPSEGGAVFVATNIVITPNQKQSVCPEDPSVFGAKCDPNNNTCVPDEPIPLGNGQMTGKCVQTDDNSTYTCEIHAWCPVERDILPLKNKQPVLKASQNFTLLIKNFVAFPKFNKTRRNIKDTSNKAYLQSCRYDAHENPDCPVFVLGDMIKWAGEDFDELALKGAVIAIIIDWNCNFDFNEKYCFPKYSFRRLDDAEAKLAPGWNFRYANYYSDSSRTLYKLYGIKFVLIVQGQAGKFMIIPLLLNIGAGLGLLALEVVICDLVVLYLTKERKFYKSKKYEDVLTDTEDEFLVAPSTFPGENSFTTQIDDDGYQPYH